MLSPTPVRRCSQCGLEKPRTTEFFARKRDGWRSACKLCSNATQREVRRLANQDELTQQRREYRLSNLDRFRGYERRYLQKNEAALRARRRTPEYRAIKAAYARRWRRQSPEARIRTYLTNKFNAIVTDPTKRKVKTFVARFGYSPQELRAHLERQFTPAITWENYGTVWEVDHIVPIRCFRLPEETLACWALTNLRPLRKSENRCKQGRRFHLL